jgi:hypothetical protein
MSSIKQPTVEINTQPESTEPVNTQLLIETINSLVERFDKLMDQSEASPDKANEIWTLGREIEDLSNNLAYAATALDILGQTNAWLRTRAEAYAEVFGTEYPDEPDFSITIRVGPLEFGNRFGPKYVSQYPSSRFKTRFTSNELADLPDEQVPF